MVDYVALIITSAFTGIGTALGLAMFELFLKERVHNIGNKIKDVTSIPKRLSNKMSKMQTSIPKEQHIYGISPELPNKKEWILK